MHVMVCYSITKFEKKGGALEQTLRQFVHSHPKPDYATAALSTVQLQEALAFMGALDVSDRRQA